MLLVYQFTCITLRLRERFVEETSKTGFVQRVVNEVLLVAMGGRCPTFQYVLALLVLLSLVTPPSLSLSYIEVEPHLPLFLA